ncbi:hemicentin-1-like isoform X1, partial [Tachysurus ichikawai]
MLYLIQLPGMVFLTLLNGAQSDNCSDLVLDPPELAVRYGDPVSVSCRSLSNDTDLAWSVPTANVFSPDTQTITWETDNLTDWEIQPVCYKETDVQCNRTLPLTVYKLPDQVFISIMSHSGPMIEGREYNLQCDIHTVAPIHLLNVAWYKGLRMVNNSIFNDKLNKSPETISTMLQIFPSRDDDGVQYRCEATLNLGQEFQASNTVSSDPLNITITSKPKNCADLVLDPPELVVRYGDPVSVSCHSLSNDTDLVWSVPTGIVFSPDTQTITWETDNLTDWEIQPVCYKNRTDVQCERALQIIVYKIPEKVSISFVNHIGPMTAGKKYELQCDIENFAPVHVLAVFWYKGDQPLKNRGFSDLPTKTPSNKIVTLKVQANRTDSDAPYRCEARLKLGAAGPQPPPIVTSNLLPTEVQYKPVITCSDWSAMVNTPLSSYPYNVMGKPSPVITWYRNQSPVSSDMHLSRSDTGQYRFTASNKMGSSSCDTEINVEYPPTFHCPDNYTGKENESFLGKCSVMASPVANITWTKDGKTVSPLHSLTRGDSGLYVITAVNKHGDEQHRLTIKVLDGCPIIIQPAKLVVEFGAFATANCSTTISHNGMGWEAVIGAVDKTTDVQFLIWRVESL